MTPASDTPAARPSLPPGAARRLVAIAVAIIALIAAGVVAYRYHGTSTAPVHERPVTAAAGTEISEPPPLLFQPLTEQQALQANAVLPFSTMPNPAAAPFILPQADVTTYTAALDCMTAAIYYEAGFENEQGRAAVAQVILNRVRHPLYPKSVCGVVFQGSERTTGCQFTFTCDGALLRAPNPRIYEEARVIAAKALAGTVEPTVGWSTHYHTQWVLPYWGPKLAKTALIGAHIFYRFPAPLGVARWFTGTYAGTEPAIALMAGLTSSPVIEAPLVDLSGITVEAAAPDLPTASPLDSLPARDIGAPSPPVTDLADRPEPKATPTEAAPAPADAYFPPPRRRTRNRLPM